MFRLLSEPKRLELYEGSTSLRRRSCPRHHEVARRDDGRSLSTEAESIPSVARDLGEGWHAYRPTTRSLATLGMTCEPASPPAPHAATRDDPPPRPRRRHPSRAASARRRRGHRGLSDPPPPDAPRRRMRRRTAERGRR